MTPTCLCSRIEGDPDHLTRSARKGRQETQASRRGAGPATCLFWPPSSSPSLRGLGRIRRRFRKPWTRACTRLAALRSLPRLSAGSSAGSTEPVKLWLETLPTHADRSRLHASGSAPTNGFYTRLRKTQATSGPPSRSPNPQRPAYPGVGSFSRRLAVTSQGCPTHRSFDHPVVPPLCRCRVVLVPRFRSRVPVRLSPARREPGCVCRSVFPRGSRHSGV